MSEMVFCYHCRRQHPRAEVIRVETRGVKRWRCRRSLALAQRSIGERDAFGAAVSADNHRAQQPQAQRPLPRPVLELFAGAAPLFGSAACAS